MFTSTVTRQSLGLDQVLRKYYCKYVKVKVLAA